MKSITVLLFLVALVATVNSSCRCHGSSDGNDQSSDIICDKMDTVFDGIEGKSVSQCHDVIINNDVFPPSCSLQNDYDPVNDQSLLHSTGVGYVIHRVYQPGYYSNQCYDTGLFCAYNIQCAPNQFLYYHFSSHDIENPQPDDMCLDGLTLVRDSIPNHDVTTCGRVGVTGTYADFGIVRDGYESQRLKVQFRSNTKCTTSGYFLWVECVNDTLQSSPGCFRNVKKRTVTTEKESRYGKQYKRFVKVPLKGILEYSGYTLTVKVNNVVKYTSSVVVSSLNVKSTDKRNKNKIYYSSSKNVTRTFYGSGKLYVSCTVYGKRICKAVYLMEGVPSAYRMNAKEEREIGLLLSSLVPLFKQERNQYRTLRLSKNNSSRSVQEEIQKERQKRTFSSFKPHVRHLAAVILGISWKRYCYLRNIAIRNSNSCKAVVRSVSRYFLNTVDEEIRKRQ